MGIHTPTPHARVNITAITLLTEGANSTINIILHKHHTVMTISDNKPNRLYSTSLFDW